MKAIDKLQGFLAGIGAVVSSTLIFGMMALIFVDVTGRFLFNKPIFGSYEVVQMGMGLVVFYALPYAQYKKGLVRVDFIINYFPRLPRKILWVLGDVISTCVCYALAYACYLHASGTLVASGAKTSVLMMPLYPFYYVASVGLLLFALILTVDCVHSLLSVFRKDEDIVSSVDAEMQEMEKQF
ncbi:MAG: TRAP transporter small permease [Clostridiales Family XIII bacterium]|jgi:TRAP-type C4-dicarboxylate transport system permease small subunit|nr:TRAP transporter small permease [Clostridiales Family XIII bacterium]